MVISQAPSVQTCPEIKPRINSINSGQCLYYTLHCIVTVTCVIVSVVAVSCVEGWCCVLGWCPFYSLGVVAVLCSPNTMCIDPGVWSLLSWLGFTTTAIVPTIWLTADSWLRAQARRILPGVCAGEESHIQVALGNSSAGSTVSTEFTTVDRVPGRNALK